MKLLNMKRRTMKVFSLRLVPLKLILVSTLVVLLKINILLKENLVRVIFGGVLFLLTSLLVKRSSMKFTVMLNNI